MSSTLMRSIPMKSIPMKLISSFTGQGSHCTGRPSAVLKSNATIYPIELEKIMLYSQTHNTLPNGRPSRLNRWILTGLCLFSAHALAEFGVYRDHQVSDQSLIVNTSAGSVTLTLHNNQAMEVFYQPDGIKQLPGNAVAAIKARDLAPKLVETDASIAFGSDELTAVIHKNPLHIDYLRHHKPLVSEEAGLFVQDSVRGFRFSLDPDEKILGGGERVLGMDRRGHKMPLYNKAHYGYETESNQMYFGLPAIMSDQKYMLIFDNAATGQLDIGATEKDVLQFEAVGGRTSYLVVSGDTYPSLIDAYTQMTGRQPLPPRWAFGNFASRFGYHSEAEVRDTIAKFRAQDFPVDALVLDLYWFGKDVKGHMGNLAWDKQAFPNPTQMISDLKADGVNTILITEPFVLTSSKRWQEAVDTDVLAKNAAGKPKTFDFYFGNSGLIDVFHAPAQAWFWSIYQELMLQGVAGWWGDLGEPEVQPDDSIHRLTSGAGDVQGCKSAASTECVAAGNEIHNAYGHQWAKMVYENQRRRFPETRPMVMMRSGFAGSQRYGFIPWTGDVSRSWGGLKPQVELALQMSLFGLGYTHSDLGGFAGGDAFDKELYIRWLEYGVFQPVYRPHAQEEIAPEPVFHDQETQDILRPYVKLRYQMLPYNYTLAYENSTRGMPLMRPLFFENEADSSLIENTRSYLWGDAFLVTPVTEAGVKSVTVALPKGVWYDYFSRARYQGGKTIEQPTDLKTLPVLVRAGSFVPMTESVNSTRDYSSEKLTLHYYHDKTVKQAAGQMYEDDGKNPQSLSDQQFELLHFNARLQRHGLKFELTRSGSYSGQPTQRELTLIVHNLTKAPRKATVNGKPVRVIYQEASQQATLVLTWDEHTQTVVIQ